MPSTYSDAAYLDAVPLIAGQKGLMPEGCALRVARGLRRVAEFGVEDIGVFDVLPVRRCEESRCVLIALGIAQGKREGLSLA